MVFYERGLLSVPAGGGGISSTKSLWEGSVLRGSVPGMNTQGSEYLGVGIHRSHY